MSHCTAFLFAYTDEEMAVACFRRLGLSPSTEALSEYSNSAAKALGMFGYVGRKQMRAIIARCGEYNYFFRKEGEVYRLIVDCPTKLDDQDRPIIARMEAEFREMYVRLAVERLAERFENSGTPSRIEQSAGMIKLCFGPDFSRSIKLKFTKSPSQIMLRPDRAFAPSSV